MVSSLTGQGAQPPAGASSEDQARTTLEAIHDPFVGPPAGSLPSPPPGMAVLPFPDENGNPILVRITNQAITILPFPDSQGQPIPVAPGVPGLKLLAKSFPIYTDWTKIEFHRRQQNAKAYLPEDIPYWGCTGLVGDHSVRQLATAFHRARFVVSPFEAN